MRCISPLLIRQNGERHTVPCGKCNFCLSTRRADWSFRLVQEEKVSYSAYFLTLTYEDSKLPISKEFRVELRKRDIQLFIKRLRKDQAQISEKKLRYYAVGEYGTQTDRPHYHIILFNLEPVLRNKLPVIWQMGMVDIGDVTPASIHYVTKYVINRYDDCKGREPPFALMSRKPALGANYLKTHTEWHRRGELKDYAKVGGQISRLPRYYKEKIFSPLERQKLAIENIHRSDVEYWEAVQKLAKFSSDPERYYDERLANQHEKVKNKVNSTNKF